MNTQIKLWHALLLTLVVSVLAAWGAYNDGENKSLQERLKKSSIEVGFNQSEAAPPKYPDLVVGAPRIISQQIDQLTGGVIFTFSADVNNVGKTSVNRSFSNSFYFDSNYSNPYYADTVNEVPFFVNDPLTINSGGVLTGNTTITKKGTHTARFCIDEGNFISELNEANNCGPTTSFVVP